MCDSLATFVRDVLADLKRLGGFAAQKRIQVVVLRVRVRPWTRPIEAHVNKDTDGIFPLSFHGFSCPYCIHRMQQPRIQPSHIHIKS